MIATHDRVRTEQRRLSACSSQDAVMSASEGFSQGQCFQSFVIAQELLPLQAPQPGRLFSALMTAPMLRVPEKQRRGLRMNDGGLG